MEMGGEKGNENDRGSVAILLGIHKSNCLQRTVAGDDQELVLAGVLVNGDVGVGGNDLVLGFKSCALLKLEVSKSAGQCEVACRSRASKRSAKAQSRSSSRAGSDGERRIAFGNAPLTRPNSTNPPAATIREVSPLLVGLWSNESGLASPPSDMTARESPALAFVDVRTRSACCEMQEVYRHS